MKKLILLLLTGFAITACSTDDDNSNNNNGTVNESYLPASAGNFWVYNVESPMLNGRDSIYMSNDTVINNNNYKKIRSNTLPFGFYSNALNNNAIRIENGKTLLSGNAGLDILLGLPVAISVNDFILFDENAVDGQQLSVLSGAMQQEFDGFTFFINYTLSSEAVTGIDNLVVENEQYNNIRPVEIKLNLSVNVGVPGFPISYPILSSQDVAVSTQYYALGVGAVKTTTNINYQLNQIPGFELPIPQSGASVMNETLINYNVE